VNPEGLPDDDHSRWLRGELRFKPLQGIPNPEGIVPQKLQDRALKLIALYENSDRRFWIAFWFGVFSPIIYALTIIALGSVFGPFTFLGQPSGERMSPTAERINNALFLYGIVVFSGFGLNFAFEQYCRWLFRKIDSIYFKQTGKTPSDFEKALIQEAEQENNKEGFKAKLGEFKRQKYKAYVCYSFYELVIPQRKRLYKKVPIED